MISIEFNEQDKSLTIKSSKPITDFCELMDELGDNDIVQANEIKQDYIAFEGFVYSLGDNDISNLSKNGEVSLSFLGTVIELADAEFISWYY